MPPPMALSVSSSSATTLPPFPARRRLLLPTTAAPAAPRLLRGRVFSTGYAASFYGGAARTRSRDNEEVGDEDGSSSGFGVGLGMSASEAALALEEREMPPCPPGLRQYETMVVLRPDMSEEERLALIQRYEEVTKPTSSWPFCLSSSSREHAMVASCNSIASPAAIPACIPATKTQLAVSQCDAVSAAICT